VGRKVVVARWRTDVGRVVKAGLLKASVDAARRRPAERSVVVEHGEESFMIDKSRLFL
jgi:hypothetical protein